MIIFREFDVNSKFLPGLFSYHLIFKPGYLAEKTGGETLEHYLADRVFAGSQGSTLPPDPADSAGFARFLADYRRALPVQRAAGEALT